VATRIDISQAPDWAKKLEGKMHDAALRGVRSAGLRMVQHIQTDVIPREPRVPVDKGIYLAAWRAKNVENGSLVTNDSPHAGFVEDGVRGENVKVGRNMIDALTDWVLRHGLATAAGGQKRGEGGRFVGKVGRTAAARSIAFAIATSMKVRGIFGGTGLKILAKGMREAPRFLEEEITRELKKI
jgi:hypothetical protein